MAEAFYGVIGFIIIFAVALPLVYMMLSGIVLSVGLYNIFLTTAAIAFFAVVLFIGDIWRERTAVRNAKLAKIREKEEREREANEARIAITHQSGRAKLLTQFAEIRRYVGNMRPDKDNTQTLLLVDNVIDRIRSDDDISHHHLADNVIRHEIDGLVTYFETYKIPQSELLVHRLRRLSEPAARETAVSLPLVNRNTQEKRQIDADADNAALELSSYRRLLLIVAAVMPIILLIFAIVSGIEARKTANYERCIANNGWFCSRHL